MSSENREHKAWREAFDFPVPGRAGKPRTKGLTMVIDKGLGLTETNDLLDLASDYVDYIKLTFGTSAFYSTRLLQQKIALVRSYGVDIFPGGTFLEIAVLQNRVEGYMERARELGFTFIEISDGTIEMSPEVRRNAIRAALKVDLKVICEVGKKDPSENMPHKRMQEQIAADLEHGAYKVIVEGRESGKGVVIYDADGKIRADEMEALVKGVPNPESLIWEAPLKNQQEELIMRFGPNVSLGNIQPAEVLALEALRVGLRGDTLKACIRGVFKPVL